MSLLLQHLKCTNLMLFKSNALPFFFHIWKRDVFKYFLGTSSFLISLAINQKIASLYAGPALLNKLNTFLFFVFILSVTTLYVFLSSSQRSLSFFCIISSCSLFFLSMSPLSSGRGLSFVRIFTLCSRDISFISPSSVISSPVMG